MTLRRPRRLAAFGYVGRYGYFLTFCTHDRRKIFTAHERVECARSEILRTCTERGFALPAGIFMPDHLHLLVRGLDDDSEFKSCMKVARQRSAVAFNRAFAQRLWQEGYVDCIVRDLDHERQVIRYIADNPVRSGLCNRAEDYPYSWWPERALAARNFSSATEVTESAIG